MSTIVCMVHGACATTTLAIALNSTHTRPLQPVAASRFPFPPSPPPMLTWSCPFSMYNLLLLRLATVLFCIMSFYFCYMPWHFIRGIYIFCVESALLFDSTKKYEINTSQPDTSTSNMQNLSISCWAATTFKRSVI